MRRLVEPKAIAVVGASPRAESIPGRVIETLKGNGFLGEIFPVNPRHASVSGSRAYRSLAELPAVPDVVVVVTAAPSAVSAVRQAADLGVPFAVILSSGFNETDAGSGLAKELLEIKEQSGIRILGPNCQGLVDTSRGLAIGFNAEIDPARRRKTLKEGRGVVISQSSGLGFAFANRIAEGLGGVRAIVTTGNEIDLEVADFVEFYAEDGGAPLIVFAEALRSPRRFVSAALKARSLGVDIVVIKAGTSTEGKLAAQSHTGKLTGDADIYSAVFAKAGVVTVDNSDDLIDAAGALTFGRRLPGRRIGVVTTSGGGGVWMTDHLVGAGFEVRQFPLELQARLRERLSSFAAVGNPVDVTAQSAYDSSLGFVLEILDQSQEVDGLVLVGNFGSSTWIGEGTGVEAALHSRRLPVVVYSYTEPTDGAVSLFSSLQVPCLSDPRRAAMVLKAMTSKPLVEQNPSTTPLTRAPEHSDGVSRLSGALLEPRSDEHLRRVFEENGVRFNPRMIAVTESNAIEAAGALGYPVVMKIAGAGEAHKTDIGGVAIGIKNAQDVEYYFPLLMAKAREAGGHAVSIEPHLVGHEILVGAVNDPTAGCVIAIGPGGTQVELRTERSHILGPVSPDEIVAAIDCIGESRAWRNGYRHLPPGNMESLVQLIAAFSEVVGRLAPTAWRSVECNPVIVGSSDACAVDFRFIAMSNVVTTAVAVG